MRYLKNCLFSVIVDGILESTHPVGCINTNSLHPEKEGKDKKDVYHRNYTQGVGSL